MTNDSYNLNTQCLHAGQVPDPTTMSRAVPIYRTSSYTFRDTEHAANLFGLKELGNIYTRLMNPTTDVLEQRVAAMEGGAAALGVASGTSGIFYSVVNICQAGDEIVSAQNLYGGTFTMFNNILPQFGIKANFVDISDADAIKAAINDKTKLLYCETIGNPGLEVCDLEMLSTIAHDHGIPLVVDSTFTTPCLLRPIEYGADVIIHSLTKWMGGHGNGIGGVVVDAGKFDWTSGKFPLMSEPDSSYHGLRFAHDLGPLSPIAYILRMRVVPLRNLGACISPDNAWQFLQGIETVHLRMERHSENAMKVAEFLSAHPKIKSVNYPGLKTDKNYQIASKYLKKGFGAVVVFDIKGGQAAGQKFIESLKLFSHLANVGDSKSLAIHPATTTHSQMNEEEQKAAGITPGLVRLSIGIEDIDDIMNDLTSALG